MREKAITKHRKKGCRKRTSGTELARESISELGYRNSVYRCMQNIFVCCSTYLLQPSLNRDMDLASQLSTQQVPTQYVKVKVRQLGSQIKLVCQLARQHTTPQQSFTSHLASSQILAKPDGPYQPTLYYYYSIASSYNQVPRYPLYPAEYQPVKAGKASQACQLRPT